MSVDRVGIFSVEEWFDTCPPKKGAAQWKDGFSAKECAKAWLRQGRPVVPEELKYLWRSSPELDQLEIATAHPEVETPLDDYRGGRNADLVLLGMSRGKRALVAIEAKAGEDFGPVVAPYIKQSVSGNIPDRIDGLSEILFGRPVVTYDPELAVLRYQLLHAVVGTVIEASARNAEIAAMVVHYFPNDRAPLEQSLEDFQDFVRAATGGKVRKIQPGEMVELELPGNGRRVPLRSRVWVGWATAPVIE